MHKRRKSVGTTGIPDGSYIYSGVAYIAIPEDVDRALFIRNCCNTRTVFMRNDAGDKWKNVTASNDVFRNIRFPQTSEERGSGVVWVKIPKHQFPIIVDVYDLKDGLSIMEEENQVRFQRISDNGSVDFNIKANTPEAILDVVSKINGKGRISLNVTNPDETAVLDVYVKGSAGIHGSKDVTVKSNNEVRVDVVKDDNTILGSFSYKSGIGWTLIDEFSNKLETKDDGIFFNDGTNKGLVILANLVQKINQLENSLNGLIAVYNTHTHITTATVAATPTPGILAPTTSTSSNTIAPVTLESDLENIDVKH